MYEELFYVLHHHGTANEIRSGKLYILLLECPDMEHRQCEMLMRAQSNRNCLLAGENSSIDTQESGSFLHTKLHIQ